jgi:hypothetical protein
VKTETVYALYLGDTEETNADGRALVFGLANGETATYNLAEVADADAASAINTAVAAANAGNTVYKLTITDGKLSAAAAQTATYKGHAQYVDSYILRTGVETPDYLGTNVTKAWDISGKATAVDVQEAMSDPSATPPTYKGDYVYLYVADSKVVFIVKPADLEQTAKTVTFTATLVKRDNGSYWFEDVVSGAKTNGVDNVLRWIDNDGNVDQLHIPQVGTTPIASENAALYVGKTFTVSYTIDVNCEGVGSNKSNFSVTLKTDVNADGFYLYKDNDGTKTLTYVDATVSGGKTEYTLAAENKYACPDNTVTYIVVENGAVKTVSTTAPTLNAHYKFTGGYTSCSVGSHATIMVYTYA